MSKPISRLNPKIYGEDFIRLRETLLDCFADADVFEEDSDEGISGFKLVIRGQSAEDLVKAMKIPCRYDESPFDAVITEINKSAEYLANYIKDKENVQTS